MAGYVTAIQIIWIILQTWRIWVTRWGKLAISTSDGSMNNREKQRNEALFRKNRAKCKIKQDSQMPNFEGKKNEKNENRQEIAEITENKWYWKKMKTQGDEKKLINDLFEIA